MTAQNIRPIAICLFRNGDRILVFKDSDSVKGDSYCRPLGGGIEFGESSHNALIREIREELGAEIENVELAGVLENIFTLEGRSAHEIIFVYDAQLQDRTLYERDEIAAFEHVIDTPFIAHWVDWTDLPRQSIRLVPDGLAELLATLPPQD